MRNGKKILIFGGTGFVGQSLVSALSRGGHHVSVPSRFVFRHRGMQLLPNVHLVELDDTDLLTKSRMADLIEGHDAVINLVGILNEPGHDGKTFQRVHVDWTKKILKGMAQTDTARYLHMSALSADPQAPSFYLRTKGEAENWVHDYGADKGIAVTSFRPSVIFGAGDSFLNRFAGLARWMPGIFPLACAEARFAPVYVGDVARSYMAALKDDQMAGSRLDLCGPRDYSLRQLVDYAAATAGHPRLVVGLPDWAARMQARMLEFVPGKPFSRDNYASLQIDSICPAECPRQPTTLEAIAPRYLGRS